MGASLKRRILMHAHRLLGSSVAAQLEQYIYDNVEAHHIDKHAIYIILRRPGGTCQAIAATRHGVKELPHLIIAWRRNQDQIQYKACTNGQPHEATIPNHKWKCREGPTGVTPPPYTGRAYTIPPEQCIPVAATSKAAR